MVIPLVLFLLISYLLGAVPFGKIVARAAAGINIMKRGSGNIGATNVARELGLHWGLVTLALDVLKGFVPAVLYGIWFPGSPLLQACVGLSALAGHQYSVFLRFRGGKGVATALGVYLALSPLSALLAMAVFVLIVALLDMISLGSILCAALMPFFIWIVEASVGHVAIAAVMAVLIGYAHRDNIRRMVRGEERKWKGRATGQEHQEGDPTPHSNRNRP
jgi:glycerol-3-phosphate acyltransferase PlsY